MGREDEIFDESDDYFKIKGNITVSQPAADEVLHVGVLKNIQWSNSLSKNTVSN